MRSILGLLTAMALLAAATAVYFAGVARQTRAEVAELRQQALPPARFAALEAQLTEAMRRATAADEKNGQLLKELEGLRAKAAAAATTAATLAAEAPITREAVQERFRVARELARNGGDAATALREFLWCYDEGMVRIAVLQGVRTSALAREIAQLGASYPPALEALRERRDRIEQRVLANDRDNTAMLELSQLNQVLGDKQRNLELFDKLSANDRRRESLLSSVQEQLLAARRYADVVSARPFSRINSYFEMTIAERPLPANIPNPERLQQTMRTSILRRAMQDFEALAGAGEMENARLFAGKVLAYDNTPETRALLEQHAKRAGQPDLLSASAAP